MKSEEDNCYCLPTTSILCHSMPPQCKTIGLNINERRSLVEEEDSRPQPKLTCATCSTVRLDAGSQTQLASTDMHARVADRQGMEKPPVGRTREETFG